ncbi:hypothetical protein C8R45DRAFT_931790 [Mycena sanguinolenta]|nr:hypothetical protein C8R45DRAFT_931790 [Mycena sanguinolenta]
MSAERSGEEGARSSNATSGRLPCTGCNDGGTMMELNDVYYLRYKLVRWVLETAQLAQIGVIYNITSELKLRPPPNPNPQGSCRVAGYDAALLIGPTAVVHEIPVKVLEALATRFNLRNQKTILMKQ